MATVTWLVPAFPLLGAFVLALAGKFLRKGAVATVAVGTVGLSFLVSAAWFFTFLGRAPAARWVDQTIVQWVKAGPFSISLGLLIDPLSLLFMLIITGVGFLIHLYSVGYMGEDEGFSRYFSYMNLFVFAMLLLVMSDNFLGLLIGWAGVGLASYLLIGFWYERPSAVAAAKKAFVLNVAGDVGITIALFLLLVHFGTVGYAQVFAQASTHLARGSALADWLAVLLYLGAAAKSAQFPLHVWLPDAMEGPTPVSALIHAATMVTAGVYLLARAYPLFHAAPGVSAVVAAIGAGTALFAALIGVSQWDIKRVLAYSTVSQLGYMFLAVGVGAYAAGLFHLTTHAFFKALLFLAAGAVIHALAGEQDLRKMGGLAKALPSTYWTFLVGTLAIAGIPGLSGFFSKDEILGTVLNLGHPVLWAVGVVTAGVTAYYMFRLLYLAFSGTYRGDVHPHAPPPVMTVPLWILAALSAVGGYLVVPGAWNAVSAWLAPVFSRYPGGTLPPAADAFNVSSMAWTLLFVLLGWYGAYRLYVVGSPAPERVRQSLGVLYRASLQRFYIDELGEWLLIRPVLFLSAVAQRVDRAVIDGAVRAVGQLVAEWGESLRPIQTGHVRRYALSIATGVVGLLVWITILIVRGGA